MAAALAARRCFALGHRKPRAVNNIDEGSTNGRAA
jgi:hypothetical protein